MFIPCAVVGNFWPFSFIEMTPSDRVTSRLCCNSFGFVHSMTFLSQHLSDQNPADAVSIGTSNTIQLYTISIATSHYSILRSYWLLLNKYESILWLYDMYNHDNSKQNRPHEWRRGKAKRWTTHFTRDFRIDRSLWRYSLESQPPGVIPTQYG